MWKLLTNPRPRFGRNRKREREREVEKSPSNIGRYNSACYIAEVFTFMALILISCDSLALSSQTTCIYIDKNLISD